MAILPEVQSLGREEEEFFERGGETDIEQVFRAFHHHHVNSADERTTGRTLNRSMRISQMTIARTTI